jgi:hypothetical protein
VEDDGALAHEAARVLRPGGDLVVTVPAMPALWSRHDELHHHYRRYTRSALRRVLQQAGLSCVRLTYYNTLLFPAVVVSRVLERVSPRWMRSSASDYERGFPGAAGLLRWTFSQERRLLPRWRLPFGVSLLALARPPVTRSRSEGGIARA